MSEKNEFLDLCADVIKSFVHLLESNEPAAALALVYMQALKYNRAMQEIDNAGGEKYDQN